MKHLLSAMLVISAAASLSTIALAIPFSDPRADRIAALDASGAMESRDPACGAATLVSAGGLFPRNPPTLAVRWVGFFNYQLVYNCPILLLYASYDPPTF